MSNKTMEIILLYAESFTALVFLGMSLPLILRKVPPNDWFGVRTKKTLTNEDIWYEANAYFGKDFLIASLTVLLACVGLSFMRDMIEVNTFLLLVSTVLMVPYIVAVVRTFWYLRKL